MKKIADIENEAKIKADEAAKKVSSLGIGFIYVYC